MGSSQKINTTSRPTTTAAKGKGMTKEQTANIENDTTRKQSKEPKSKSWDYVVRKKEKVKVDGEDPRPGKADDRRGIDEDFI